MKSISLKSSHQLLLCFFSAFCIFGCSTLAGTALKISPLDSIELVKLDDKNLDIRANTEVTSRFGLSASASDVSVRLTVADYSFSAIPIDTIRLDGSKPAPVSFDFNLEPDKIPETFFHALWQEKVDYVAEIRARPTPEAKKIRVKLEKTLSKGDSFFVSLDSASSHQVLQFRGIQNFGIGPGGVRSKIRIRVRNPFSFPLEVSELETAIKTTSLDMGKVTTTKALKIRPKSSATLELDHYHRWSNPLTALASLPSLIPPFDVLLEGSISVKTESGKSRIPFKGTYTIKRIGDFLADAEADRELERKKSESLGGVPKPESSTPPPSPPQNEKVVKKNGSKSPIAGVVIPLKKPNVDLEVSAQENRLQDLKGCQREASLVTTPQDLAASWEAQLGRTFGMTAAEEEELGKNTINAVAKQMGGTVDRTSPRARYVQRIGKLLAKRSTRKDMTYEFSIIQGVKTENALAAPGGFITITEGFLDRIIENEAQLAGVLGHEIAHIELRHPTAIAGALRKTLGKQHTAGLVELLATKLISFPYNAAKESDADEWGLEASYKTGYSALTVADLWHKMAKKHEKLPPSSKTVTNKRKQPNDAIGIGLDVFDIAIKTAEKELEAVLQSHPKSGYRACSARLQAAQLHKAYRRQHSVLGTLAYQKKQPALP